MLLQFLCAFHMVFLGELAAAVVVCMCALCVRSGPSVLTHGMGIWPHLCCEVHGLVHRLTVFPRRMDFAQPGGGSAALRYASEDR